MLKMKTTVQVIKLLRVNYVVDDIYVKSLVRNYKIDKPAQVANRWLWSKSDIDSLEKHLIKRKRFKSDGEEGV